MIIDIHTHIFTDKMCNNRDDYMSDENFSHLYNSPKSNLYTHDYLLKSMNESGVDYAAAVGFSWKKKEFCEEQNIYFQHVAENSGGRILPFGSVPIDEKNDIEGWVKDIKEKGLFGIGEIGFYTGGMKDENMDYLDQVLAAAKKYSLIVSLHLNEPVGHSYTGKYEPQFSELYDLLMKYAEVKIIFAHWGGGLLFYELMPEISKSFTNFYYDTAASPYIYRDDVYKVAVDILGSEKVVFGSDFPLLKFERYFKSIKATGLNQRDQENILGNSAAELFGLTVKKEKA